MRIRAAFLSSFVFVLTALPAHAQGPGGPPPNYQQLVSQMADLQARVNKLEGNITAADLAGTYSALILDTSMRGFRPGTPPRLAAVETSSLRGSITLNADGTGSTAFIGCEGSSLTLNGAMTGLDCGEGESENTGVTWTYAAGVVTITFLNDGDQIPFNVAVGGRLLTMGFAPFHASDLSSDSLLIILTRLR